MANSDEDVKKPLPQRLQDQATQLVDATQSSQAWNSIFRPGSIFRKGYTDSPRNRSYVIMNSVLYHLHPVKVKRHAVKVSYTLCLGGLKLTLGEHELSALGLVIELQDHGPFRNESSLPKR